MNVSLIRLGHQNTSIILMSILFHCLLLICVIILSLFEKVTFIQLKLEWLSSRHHNNKSNITGSVTHLFHEDIIKTLMKVLSSVWERTIKRRTLDMIDTRVSTRHWHIFIFAIVNLSDKAINVSILSMTYLFDVCFLLICIIILSLVEEPDMQPRPPQADILMDILWSD